jgi:hypothetical protein
VVCADHEVCGDGPAARGNGEAGLVALDPGQRPGLGFQLVVDALDRAVQGDEPVALDRGQPGHGFRGFGDLLVHPVQGPPGPVGPVLVVDDLVTALVFRPGGQGWVKTCPSGISWPGCSRRQASTT